MLVLLRGLFGFGLVRPAPERNTAIATYAQWRAAIDAGDLRRVTWVAGDQPILIEEVVDALKDKLSPSTMDYISLSLSPTLDRDVWAEANQYPLTPGSNRLILVRDADTITRWQPLQTWLARTRTLPGVYLLFVSSQPDLPYTTVGGKKTLKPHVALLKAPRGFVVRCTGLNEADAVAWVQRRSPLDAASAQYLLTRTGGNLAAAAAVCAKVTLFGQSVRSVALNTLITEQAADDFTDYLIALDKRRALLALPDLDDADRLKAVALLDSRLDLLERLNRIHTAGRSWRDVTGINPFLLRLYMPYARHYDSSACSNRRRALAVIDDALRSGARDAVMESLVALW